MRFVQAAAALLIAIVSGMAAAQEPSTVAVDANVGTLGIGAGVVFPLSERFVGRLGLAGGRLTRSVRESDVDYDVKIKLLNAPVLLDWHPGGSWFRLSAGVIVNGDKANVDGKPSSSGTYNLNGTVYSASSVGSLSGTVKYDRWAPYFGFGFGNPVPRVAEWSFSMDVGAMNIGQPVVSLTASCGPGLNGAQCAQLQNDANGEADQLRDALKNHRWYPVVQLYAVRAF